MQTRMYCLPARHTHAHVTRKPRLRRAAGGRACDATHFDEARQQRERVRPRHGDRRGGVAPVERRAAFGPRVRADRDPDAVLEQQQLSGAEGRDHRRARPPRREQLRQRARACVDGRVSACTLRWSVGLLLLLSVGIAYVVLLLYLIRSSSPRPE